MLTESVRPYNSTFDGDPEVYDRLRTCWLNERREAFISNRLTKYQLPTGTLVVEIGSGTGWLLNRLGRRFPALRFLGFEPIAGYVEYARMNALSNVTYLQTTIEDAGALPDAPMVVLSNDVLHHVPSYAGAIQSISRFAAPRCRWLAIEPNCGNPYTFTKQALGYGEQNFWPGQFRTAAGDCGWELTGKGHLFLIPPTVREPRGWMKTLEAKLDWIPCLAGGVHLEFVYNGSRIAARANRIIAAAHQ